jgi:hypothetical protein
MNTGSLMKSTQSDAIGWRFMKRTSLAIMCKKWVICFLVCIEYYELHCTPPCPDVAGGGGVSYGPWKPFLAPMISNTRVTSPDHFQDTRHIVLGLQGSGFSYEPGDLLAIFPRTPEEAVQVSDRKD